PEFFAPRPETLQQYWAERAKKGQRGKVVVRLQLADTLPSLAQRLHDTKRQYVRVLFPPKTAYTPTNPLNTRETLLFALSNGELRRRLPCRDAAARGQPAKGTIDALEDTTVLLWSKDNWERLKRDIPAFDTLQEHLLSRSLDAQVDRLHITLSLPAEERYHAFRTAFPDLYRRVPLHMIASYLG
nr:hypothetical protein [Tanacetum cinerariifolium]